MLKSVGQALAPGFYCRNESQVPILVVLSQLSPLHWLKIEPGLFLSFLDCIEFIYCFTGQTGHLNCGRVFFTVSVEPWAPGKEPTKLEVAARLTVVITSTVLLGSVGLLGSGLLSGVTSFRKVRKSGVYANGRTMVVRGSSDRAGNIHLAIFSFESPSAQMAPSAPVEAQPELNFFRNVNYQQITQYSDQDHMEMAPRVGVSSPTAGRVVQPAEEFLYEGVFYDFTSEEMK